METLFMTVWFFAIAGAGGALAATLILRAVRADDRDVAQFEAPAMPTVVTPVPGPRRVAA